MYEKDSFEFMQFLV